jgi:hypothetical protein
MLEAVIVEHRGSRARGLAAKEGEDDDQGDTEYGEEEPRLTVVAGRAAAVGMQRHGDLPGGVSIVPPIPGAHTSARPPGGVGP